MEHTKERKANISEGVKKALVEGRFKPAKNFLGKHHPQEIKEKISKALKEYSEKPNGIQCIVCGTPLKGIQKKFCSRKCINSVTNKKNQNYTAQLDKGWERKRKLIEAKGGECSVCGYKRNYASLAFHHTEPAQKSFSLDIRTCSNRKWESLLIEAEKCIVLCMNCHGELHHPKHSWALSDSNT